MTPPGSSLQGQPNRLDAPWGEGLDRDAPLTFLFEGRPIRAFTGDTIASALLANGITLIGRSFKYHRPRSILGLGGTDANGLVTVDGAPNVPAELTPVRQGMRVTGQNYRGSLARDRWAMPDWARRFLPVGFYYWAFYRPAFLWRFWERIIRRRAGLGEVDTGGDAHPAEPDKEYRFADVAVVGAGPAGLAAALAAAQAGASVLLLDERPMAGGQARWAGLGDEADAALSRLADAVMAAPGIARLPGARCTALYADTWLAADRGGHLYKVRARQIVLATGGQGQAAVFRRNDLPGILLADAAQELLHRYAVRPGSRAVVLTTGDAGYDVADDLAGAGIEIAAILDARPAPARETDHPRHAGTVVAAAAGGNRITGITTGPVDDPLSGGRNIACDLLVLATGSIPAGALWCQAGGRLTYDPARESLVLADPPPGLHAAGLVNGETTVAGALRDGAAAGRAAAADAGCTPPGRGGSALDDLVAGLDAGTAESASPQGSPGDTSLPDTPLPDAPLPIVPHPKGLDFVDLDEDLTVHDLTDAVAQGFGHAQLLKRFSTLGMGPSQGRHALLAGMVIAARARGAPADEVGHTTVRPPAAGLRFDTLAGRALHPARRTPLHDRHTALKAEMMPAGVWWRPAVYRTGPGAPDRAALRQLAWAEARHVRRAVGLIDVSTLGKIEVRGPDAAAFMERIYTFRYAKQPAGRSRYVLMTDEAGYVIDDGVACRLDENHFYVTTTTGASDQVFRAMLFWNAQWRLDVDIANVTGAHAAINVAGPLSREVLARVTGLDLSPEAFPYLAVREGTVAGIPARLFRVGFVGELGYEIHVPAGYGAALWDALMDAGADDDPARRLAPFGVEAQRLLRLEKGHVIVGQDTDGLTHPAEAALDWAVADKPFFVGGRAIAIHQARPPDRRLAGFRIDRGPFPEESCLVIRDGDIAGRVTSAGYATDDDSGRRIVGLAYVAPDQAEPGSQVDIRVGRATVRADIVALPFYDPDNERQAA